jgi:glutamine synthetase
VSWAPVWAAYGDNNRSCMLRLPRNRPAIENRSVDAAANPYLASAFLLAAGLEGVLEGLDPGDPVEDITYDWTVAGPQSGDVASRRLPRTLLEAVEAFEADPLTHEVFSGEMVSAYANMKRGEWDEYHAQVTDWERAKYLEMF